VEITLTLNMISKEWLRGTVKDVVPQHLDISKHSDWGHHGEALTALGVLAQHGL
jgi:hypothetical protein